MQRPAYYTATLLLIAPITAALGQNSIADTAFVAQANKNAVKLYASRVGPVSNVYNGTQYQEYRPQDDEHPYLTQDWIYGTVEYGSQRYESVSLLYDLSLDAVITMNTHGHAIQMIQQKVKSFQLGDRTFVRIKNGQLSEGFYERMYDGKAKFYARRKKVYYERASGHELTKSFESINHYYLLKDGKFHSFRSRKSLLRLLGDQKAEVRKFMRNEGISYSRQYREASAVRILRYYDQITN